MQRNVNTLEKLKELTKEEKKRRKKAVMYLEQIENELAPLLELLGDGDEYNDGGLRGFVWIKERYLYFRFKEHHEKIGCEKVGFYVSDNGLPIWGVPLEDVKGRLFWRHVSDICEWAENVLPTRVEKREKRE